LFGSYERFIGLLIEHYAGAFPVWFSPVQVKIIPVGQGHVKQAKKVAEQLKDHNIRVEVQDENETVGNKIRKAAKEKVPYMLVIGDKELEKNTVNVRIRGEEEQKEMSVEDFISEIQKKINNKE